MIFDSIIPDGAGLLPHYMVCGVIPIYFALMELIGRVTSKK